jgi:catechol 2,3-dioxygenase-like lactoylglutathione lyase family enzyme
LNVRGLDHSGIPVSNLDRSLGFYRDVFGVEPDFVTEYGDPSLSEQLRVPNPRMRIALLRLADSIAIELLEYVEPAPRPFSLRDCDVGATHLCLEVDDVEAACSELRAKGIDVYGDPFLETQSGPFRGSKWVFFKDPDGISFELVQPGASRET